MCSLSAGLSLGSPNPPMIVIAEETSDLRRCEFSSQLRLLIPTFSLPNTPAHFTVYLHSSWKCSPTTPRDESRRIHNFGIMLSPVTFLAHLASPCSRPTPR